MKRNALISVYDKSEITKICDVLDRFNIGIISTGATAKKLFLLVINVVKYQNLQNLKKFWMGE